MLLISDSFCLYHPSEATFANFLDILIVARKAILIEVPCQLPDPQFSKLCAPSVKLYLRLSFSGDPEAYWFGEHGLLGPAFAVQLVQGLEFYVEG